MCSRRHKGVVKASGEVMFGSVQRVSEAAGAVEEAQRPEAFALENVSLLYCIGFSCHIFLTIYIGAMPALPIVAYLDFEQAAIVRCVMAVFLIVGLLVLRKLEFTRNAAMRTFLLGGSCLVVCPALVSFAFSLAGTMPSALGFAGHALFGLGAACQSALWISLFSRNAGRYLPIPIALGTAAGTLLFFFAFISQSTPMVASAEFVVVSAVGVLSLAQASFGVQLVHSGEEASEARKPLHFIGKVANGSTGIMHGVAYGYASLLLCSMGTAQAVIGCSLGLVGALCAFGWAKASMRIGLGPNSHYRISTPCIVVALGLLAVVSGEVATIACLSVIVASLSFDMVSAWIQGSTQAFEFNLDPIDRFAFRQSVDWVGFLAGTVIGAVLVVVLPADPSAFDWVSVALVALTVAAFAMLGIDDEPGEGVFVTLVEEDAEPQVKILEPSETHFESQCEAVARSHGLTSRETEIFGYLARGRTAKVIQDKLVISQSTVKTHIYNIYRKLGINTQQELIQMVEDEPLDE